MIQQLIAFENEIDEGARRHGIMLQPREQGYGPSMQSLAPRGTAMGLNGLSFAADALSCNVRMNRISAAWARGQCF